VYVGIGCLDQFPKVAAMDSAILRKETPTMKTQKEYLKPGMKRKAELVVESSNDEAKILLRTQRRRRRLDEELKVPDHQHEAGTAPRSPPITLNSPMREISPLMGLSPMHQDERPLEQPPMLPEAKLEKEPKALDGHDSEAKCRRPTAQWSVLKERSTFAKKGK